MNRRHFMCQCLYASMASLVSTSRVQAQTGTAWLAAPRIATLSWEVTEHVLYLGITPTTVADADDYRSWVVHPLLPETVSNAGTRSEPNLELLARLDLDLILITPLLEDIQPKLERIAHVVMYGDFTQERNNFEMQRNNFLDLGARLGRAKLAQQELAAMDQRIVTLRQRVQTHFDKQVPAVTIIRFTSPTSVLISGPNSMPEHAMQLLGLRPGLSVPVTRWGNIQTPITSLAQIKEGAVLYLEPFPGRDRLFKTELWKQMPFVRAQRFAAVPSTWTHGGVFCVEQLARVISDALMTLPGKDAMEPQWE